METDLNITEQVKEFNPLEAAEIEAADEEAAVPGEPDAQERPPAVFISYNRQHDERVARYLYGELGQQYEVFFDQETIPLAVQFVEFAEAWLDRADFFIILISKGSLESGWVLAELERAYRLNREKGRPRVIPVRVAYTGPYPLDVHAYIGRAQALFWDDRHVAAHVARLQSVIDNGGWERPARSLNVGMDGMLVGEHRRARIAETFVAPQGVSEGLLGECKLLWLTGDADVSNYAALSLAGREEGRPLYEVTRARSWSDVNNTGVSDSAIVLRDALPSAHFEEATAGEELNALRALIERGNVVVATAPDEQFEYVRQEMVRYEFRDYQRRSLSRQSYDEAARLAIFGRLLNFSLRAGDLGEEQASWARDLEPRPLFREVVRKWSPSDIERFVVDSLPDATRAADVMRLLQRNAAIEDEVHAWFLSLDEATRCFLLTVALFPETEGELLWEKYKAVVRELRKLDSRLPVQPFGICRQRASRYVSQEGPIYVRDARVADAIRQELTKNYREFFVELTKERLREWTVPEGREAVPQEPQRKQKVKEGRETRRAVARMVGCAGRLGLDDVKGILEFWAADPEFYVRQAVADALAETARTQSGINHALTLLEQWCRESAPKGAAPRRVLAAAIALGGLASAPLDDYATQRLVQCATRLAHSRNRDVRFHLSIALRDLARGLPLAPLKGVLSQLAVEKNPGTRVSVRVNVSNALNVARARGPEGEELWSQWVNAPEEWWRWTAVCALVTWRGDKYPRLFQLLARGGDATQTLAAVCAEVQGDKDHAEAAAETFKRLVRDADGEARDNLAAALAAMPAAAEGRLLPLLRAHGSPALEEQVVEARRETLAAELDASARFAAVLRDWLAREESRLEFFKAFALLSAVEPEGRRGRVVSTLAECYLDDPDGTSGLLEKLEEMAPSSFGFLAPAVRLAAVEAQHRREPPRLIFIRRPQTAGSTAPRPTFVRKLVTRLFARRA
ncbi:MAG TPA: toll/interleukin-1 receptor domain-containing protein [Pyrinomonadaceae bacterium]